MTDMINGGPAFPTHINPRPGLLADHPQGMSLLDYFAGQACIGIAMAVCVSSMMGEDNEGFGDPEAGTAAYEIAVSLLKARERSTLAAAVEGAHVVPDVGESTLMPGEDLRECGA